MGTIGNTTEQTTETANTDKWVRGLLSRVDAKDTIGWLEYLSAEAKFYFGIAPPVVGKSAIRDAVDGFFSALLEINHDVEESWSTREAVFCRGSVTYTRTDKTKLTVPFLNVLKLDDNGLIAEYLVYADTSKL